MIAIATDRWRPADGPLQQWLPSPFSGEVQKVQVLVGVCQLLYSGQSAQTFKGFKNIGTT